MNDNLENKSLINAPQIQLEGIHGVLIFSIMDRALLMDARAQHVQANSYNGKRIQVRYKSSVGKA